MNAFVIELRDSDGNDCTVYDVLVTADSRDAVLDRVWRFIDEEYPDDEHDGNSGTFHSCDCTCEHSRDDVCDECRDAWECSHGGLLVDDYDVREYPDVESAREHHRRETYFHSLVDLT